ncbi:DUF1565 domain-containing protein [Candidatus Neomarinimicrobiota bacterium]
MNRATLFLTLCILPATVLHSQALTLWLQEYDQLESVQAVEPTADGGFILTGGTDYDWEGKQSLYIMKTNSAGQQLWLKSYRGYRAYQGSRGEDIKQTADGGFFIAGTISWSAIWLLRTDAAGDTLWTTTVGPDEESQRGANAIWPTDDGGVIVAGYHVTEEMYPLDIIRFDADGNTLWTRSYPEIDYAESISISQTSDGGFILLTLKTDVVRIDPAGEISWQIQLPDDWNNLEGAICETVDGGFITVGSNVSLNRLNANSTSLWYREYTGFGEGYPFAVHETNDGGFLVAVNGTDTWLFQTDADGNEQWRHAFGEELPYLNEGDDFKSVNEYEYILCGATMIYPTTVWLAKVTFSSPFQLDSLALIDVYQSCGGINWLNSTNWLTSQPLTTWYGVTVEVDRVTRIVLENNNVAGDLPSSIFSLSSLVELDLSGNALEDLPDLSSLPALARLDVSMNMLTFEDLEPNVGIQPDFIYTPQANNRVGSAVDTTVWEGYEITLFAAVPGTANQYQWLHNESEIPGATSNPWTINSITPADSGNYELRVTNTLVPLLTLYSEPIHVALKEYSPNLFVSVAGDNSNTGLTIEDPVKTISHALTMVDADSLHPQSIHLIEGTYSPSTSSEQFPLQIPSYVTLSGVSAQTTILDAESQSQIISLYKCDGTSIRNLTMMQGNAATGGLRCVESAVQIENTVIVYCKGQTGGGIFADRSDLILDHVTLVNNYASGGGHGLFLNHSNVGVINSIVWNPMNPLTENIKLFRGSSITIKYSDIRGGMAGIILLECEYQTCSIDWLEGNIDEDPLFCKSTHTDFSLSGSSPCVETGQDYSNMGASDIGCSTPLDAAGDEQIVPNSYSLSQNHPNPFNPTTSISYELPEGAMVQLVVYDLQGREVTRLVEDYREPGICEATWDGRDADGRALPSGIYIAQLAVQGYSKFIKMVLLK